MIRIALIIIDERLTDYRVTYASLFLQGGLLVWVNEEDHLRLMALERGCDIKATFKRFVEAAQGIEAALQAAGGHGYAWSEQLGYLLTCPSNIGTRRRYSSYKTFILWW